MSENTYFVLLKRNNGFYYYYVRDEFGRRIYRSTKERTKAAAMKVAQKRLKEEKLLSGNKRNFPKFGDFAKGFWNYETSPVVQDKLARGGRYSKDTAKYYGYQLEKYLMPAFASKFVAELSVDMIKRFLREAPLKYGISNKTANDLLINLRHILGYALDLGIITHNVAADVKQLDKGKANRYGAFTKAEAHLLLSSPWNDSIAYRANLLASCTGMRSAEIRGLLVEKVFDDYIQVDESFRDGDGQHGTKSGYGRIVPISKKVHDAIMSQVYPGQKYVFSLDGLNPVHSKYFSDKLKEQMELLNIDYRKEHLVFHSWRHFFNTRLVAANIGEAKVRSVIGHESEVMTEHYLHLSAEDLRQVQDIQEEVLAI